MPVLFPKLIVAAFIATFAVPASACEFLLQDRQALNRATLENVPAGIVSGILDCGRARYPVQFWTLVVDSSQSNLGIRDDKLFDTDHTGPLTELVSARIEDHVRVSVHERTETVFMPRTPVPEGRFMFRRFVTFCDINGTGDPLNCSVGAARIKARATASDADRDGYLDVSLHEISYYDGVSKLHVMSFVTPYSGSVTSDLGIWIEAINAVSDILKPREVASAIP